MSVDANASVVSSDVQAAILQALCGYSPPSVISSNGIIRQVRDSCPTCQYSDRELSKLICEAAMLLGLVPVFDPKGTFHRQPGNDNQVFPALTPRP